VGIVVVLMLVALYFMPTIVAAGRHKQNTGAILALNLFLGWTAIGWIVALVWALTQDRMPQIIQMQQNAYLPPGYDPRYTARQPPPAQWMPPTYDSGPQTKPPGSTPRSPS
jgi:hypothetical protein